MHVFRIISIFLRKQWNDHQGVLLVKFDTQRKRSKMSRTTKKKKKWHVRPAKTQISLGIRPVWSESSLSARRKLGSLATHWAHCEDSDQTGRMPRLSWVFAGRTVILMVLSLGGSNMKAQKQSYQTIKYEERFCACQDKESLTGSVGNFVKYINRGSYMSDRVLLILLNELGKNEMRGFAEHLIGFPQWV